MKIKVLLCLAVILSLSFVSRAQAQTFQVFNKNSLVSQGGVLVIKIADQLRDKNLRLYAFDELYSFNKNGFVFVGVGAEQKPGEYRVYLVEMGNEGKPVHYDFYYCRINVLEKEFGTPWYIGPVRKRTKAVQEQRMKEVAILNDAFRSANIKEDYTTGNFIRPLENNEVTDSFGTLRLYGRYDKKTKKIKIESRIPHSGVDLRAKTPLPVKAINSGTVLLTHYFPLGGTEGNLLIIDHGSGIISLYLHLSKFKVKKGEHVDKGQIVAMTGETPSGTPPHLHLMVKINGVKVDPLVFIDTINAVLY